MAEVKRVSAQEDIRVINEILDRDGCIVLEDALNPEALQKLREELRPHTEQTPNCHGDFYGYKTKRISSLIAKSTVCREMVIHNQILGAMDEFLLKGCKEYQLNLTQAIQIGPGEPQQMMHPDDAMFPFPHPEFEIMINCMWAVDDFTKENGATHVVPGSHKWPRNGLLPDRTPLPEEITQAEMKAGSVLIYMASLLHGGGANRSANPRMGIAMSYCLGWLRQSENQYLAVPQELATQLPERLQRLLGYFVHKPNLGQVEGRDPIELLQGKSIQNSGFEEFLPEEVRPFLDEHLQQLQAA